MNYTFIRIFTFSIIAMSGVQSCLPSRKFEHAKHPIAPNYTDEDTWVALPWRFDAADCIPQNCSIPDMQDSAKVDVFYVYPTAYVFGINWNAKYDSKNLMARVCNLTESQASAFNACAKVYTPFYRQAILKSFLNKKSGPKALNLAYEDVKAAFHHYLKYWNKGRPFIIAGHSQGSNLLTRLIKEEIDNTELQKQLVAAYLIGMPIPESTFQKLPIATKSSQTNCYISWNTFKYGTVLKEKKFFGKGKSVNPLSWKTDTTYMPASSNFGGAPTRLDHIDPNICDAQVNRGILWVHKVKKKGYMRLGDSYHLCDFSFFYMNIRENAIERTNAYLLNHK
jgi:hypothetical protein